MQNQAFQAYLQNKVMTATPEQLQLMLYEGVIRFAQRAKVALEEKDLERAFHAFSRAGAILCELQMSLRPEMDPELCDKFASLYNFCSRKLQEANLHHDTAPINDAITVLKHLRETWILVLDKISEERAVTAKMEDEGKEGSEIISVRLTVET